MKSPLTPLALLTCPLLLSTTALAQNDKIIDTPTGWAYLYSAPGADVDTQVANGFRPFAIDRTSGGNYDTLFVSNSGAYQASGGLLRRASTSTALNSYLTTNNLRILDLAAYDNGSGSVLYDAVTISNSGATAAPGWAYQIFTSWQAMIDWQAANNLRPIDIDSFPFNGGRRYTVVAVPNTGANAQSWGWAFGQTASQVTALLSQGNGARLIDIDIESVGTISNPQVLFNILFVGDNAGLGVWNYDLTSSGITAMLNNNGARLTHLERYTNAAGSTRFAVAMVDNAQPEERRIRDLMLDQMPGATIGFARRRIGGSMERSLNSTYQFEPASCMKIVHGVYAVTRFAAGDGSFSDTTYCADNCLQNANDCPTTSPNCSAGQNTLDNLMHYMFYDSNNNMTKAIEDHYGRATLNNWLAARGLDIQINHTLGCGGPPANEMSCADVTSLYAMAFDGTLFNTTWQNALRDHMIHGTAGSDSTLSLIIDQEAASTNLTSSEITEFKNAVQYNYKGGRYLYGGSYSKGTAGRFRIPSRSSLNGHSLLLYQDYAAAMFVNNTDNDAQSSRVYTLFYETVREPIHNALLTWDASCSVPPTITQDPQDDTTLGGASASFTIGYNGTNLDRTFGWYRSANGYSGWVQLANVSGHISGADTATLTITNAVSSDTGYYQGFVSTPCGYDRSASAHLTVSGQCIDPYILTQPTPQTVTAGEDAVFSTAVGGSSADRTYLWQRRAPGGLIYSSLSGIIGYSGATTSTLTVLSAADADEGDFRCRIINACGTVYTNAASLTVDPACVGPSITDQPDPTTITAGADASLHVQVSGSTAGRAFQWQRRTGITGTWTDLSDLRGQVRGTTTDTLTLFAVDPADEGTYRCSVTNDCGHVYSTAATISVNPACGSADFNGDGDTGTDADIESFFACLGGNCCPTCESADFNADGDTGTDQDIEAFFRVLSGGAC